jgi:hypothetical protein
VVDKTGIPKMRQLLIIPVLFLTVMLSSPSYAKWTKVDGIVEGDTFYLDFERIRKVDGYVYVWSLVDFLKPTESGTFSQKTYRQGDCKLFRYKFLSITNYKEPNGNGTGQTFTYNDNDWIYPSPNSAGETILQSVCSR